jgi:hypothetical protein
MSEQQQLVPTEQQPVQPTQPNRSDVEYAVNMRNAEILSQSTIVPKEFKGNPPNCFIALGLAKRMNMNPFMVMQNVVIVNGRPSWPSQFIIATINSSGRFDDILKFDIKGSGDTLECRAYTDRNGEKLVGTLVTMAMAKGEGWLSKDGSKWRTMPELMIQYRAATFFGRLYCPDLLNGMYATEEVEDIEHRTVRSSPVQKKAGTA